MRVRGLTLMAFAVLVLGGCTRSQNYVQDRDYVDTPRSYYRQPGVKGAPTKRIEVLGQPKKKILVFDFWNDTPLKGAKLGVFSADELRRYLFQTRRVMLPTDLKTRFETKDFVQGDRIKVAQLVREGRRLGVAVAVIGRISRIVFRQRGDDVGLFRQTQSLAAAEVELKVFDVQAGREIMAIGKAGEASTNAMVSFEPENLQSVQYRAELARLALREALAPTVGGVLTALSKMSWEGRVAKLKGQKEVYVNAGRASGIVAGDILRVLTPGDDVYDPVTGAFLGRTTGQLKGTVEIREFIGEDGALAVTHTGGNFKEGDVVRLY